MQCYNLFTQLIVDKGAVEALAYYLGRARCALYMQQYKGVSANAVRVLSSDPYCAEAMVLLATAMFESDHANPRAILAAVALLLQKQSE